MSGNTDRRVREVLSRRDGAWRVEASRNCPEQVNGDAQ
jgi:hypothetical protein